MNVRTVLVCALLSGPLPPQSFLVVPPGYDAVEATNTGVVAGLEQRFRHQYLVRGSDLAAMKNSAILAVWFRRDVSLGTTFPVLSTVLRIQISNAAMSPVAPSSTLALNRGTNVTQCSTDPSLSGAPRQRPSALGGTLRVSTPTRAAVPLSGRRPLHRGGR